MSPFSETVKRQQGSGHPNILGPSFADEVFRVFPMHPAIEPLTEIW
jgi:hypothetical protein